MGLVPSARPPLAAPNSMSLTLFPAYPALASTNRTRSPRRRLMPISS